MAHFRPKNKEKMLTALLARHRSTFIQQHAGDSIHFAAVGKASQSLSDSNPAFDLIFFLCVSVPESGLSGRLENNAPYRWIHLGVVDIHVENYAKTHSTFGKSIASDI